MVFVVAVAVGYGAVPSVFLPVIGSSEDFTAAYEQSPRRPSAEPAGGDAAHPSVASGNASRGLRAQRTRPHACALFYVSEKLLKQALIQERLTCVG